MKLLILPFSSSYKVLIWQWHTAQGGAAPLEVLKNHGGVVLRVVVTGHGGDELIVGPDDLEVFSYHDDSVILRSC